MSYLNSLRIHFAGTFFATPSTVNNDVRHFDNANFQPNFQLPGPGTTNGWWNPEGNGGFKLLCPATAVHYGDGTSAAPGSDPALAATVQSAETLGKTIAKIVDLDPQQQTVSMVFGMEVAIVGTPGAAPLLRGTFRPAPFTDLGQRRPTQPGDQGLGVWYQSVLESLQWGDVSGSRFLKELYAAATDGMLSIRFNLDGYSLDPGTPQAPNPQFTKGRLVGTIGPAVANEPRHFVRGRQLVGSGDFNFAVALLDEAAGKLRIDLGNSLPVDPTNGQMLDVGGLSLVCRPSAGAPVNLGNIDYTTANWYTNNAGIADLPANRSLTSAEIATVRANALVLVQNPPGGVPAVDAAIEVNDGQHVRADMFVGRLNPGDKFAVDFYATRFGQAMPAAQIDLEQQAFATPPPVPPPATPDPPMGVPQSALTFASTVTCDANGRVTVPLNASDPQNPRGYIDGQVYFVNYELHNVDPANPNDFLSVLVWDAFKPENPPTWNGSMMAIFQQFANLYPFMRDGIGIDLGNYEAVSTNRVQIAATLSVPVTNPRYMPVTRDLSDAKRAAMVYWLTSVGPGGKPLLGAAPPAPAPAAPAPPAPVATGKPGPPADSKTIAASEIKKKRLPRKSSAKKP
jgi:hypothetical protein